VVGHTTKQMKQGRSYDIQIWWLSVENVALGLRPRAISYLHVALTTVHHLYNDEFIYLLTMCCVAACVRAATVRTCGGWRPPYISIKCCDSTLPMPNSSSSTCRNRPRTRTERRPVSFQSAPLVQQHRRRAPTDILLRYSFKLPKSIW